MKPAMARRGSFTALVDGEDVARRAPHDVLGDASLDETLEEPLLAHPDDDQVDIPLLGERDDRLCRLASRLDDLGLKTSPGEVFRSLVESLASVVARVLRRVVVVRSDVRDDQRGLQRFGQVGGMRKSPALRIVERDQDRLHGGHDRHRVGARPDGSVTRAGERPGRR